MTFSRLSVEKYFLIPEGALGKQNSLATGLAPPRFGGRLGPTPGHVRHCAEFVA